MGEEERLSEKLEMLEERAEELDRKRTSGIGSIALINNRNRKDNIKKAELAIGLEIEQRKRDGITHDPFTRRQTKPKLHGKKEELKVTSEMLFQLATKGTIESQEDIEKKKAEEEEEKKKAEDKAKKEAKPE